MKKILCFDLDNVVCKTQGNDYHSSIPNKNAITKINSLYRKGFFIKIFTARYMGRNNENIKKVSTLNYTISATNKKLPDKCYTGSDTKAIANNILTEPVRDTTTVMEAVKNLLRINIEEFQAPTTSTLPGVKTFETTKFEEIYKPTFTGGAVTIIDIKTSLDDLNRTSVEYRTVYKKFVKKTEMYNKYAIYELMHSIYLLSILSNSLFAKGGYQVYKYIGRGMINFYKRIIEKIYKDLQKDKSSFDVPTTAPDETKKAAAETQLLLIEIRKKYYLTILILKEFLNNLSQQLTPNDIIDIDECSEKAIQYFTLLNHFKTILEKYNETQMNKLTIFSRVNDIGMSGDMKDGQMQNLDLQQYNNIDLRYYTDMKADVEYKKRLEYNIDNKLFVSDFLRRNIYAGYHIVNNPHEANNNLFDISKNGLLNLEIRKFSDTSIYTFTHPKLSEAYENIKNYFNSTQPENEKIESLEKYKKETLSKEVGLIFSLNYKNKIELDKINQEIRSEYGILE